jgi:hypothetical protein
MGDEGVDLLEGGRVEQQVDAVAGGQFPGVALAAQPLFTAAKRRPLPQLVQK